MSEPVMNPLPKAVGIVATIASVVPALLTIVNMPVVADFIKTFLMEHPNWSVLIGVVTTVVTALSHSLPGDGGDGSRPVN